MSKTDSEKLLANKSVGAYLLRFSSEPGNFGMSCVSKKSNAKTTLHFRVKYIPTVGYEMDNRIFSSIDDFIEEVTPLYALKQVVECDPHPILNSFGTSPYEDKFKGKEEPE